MIIIFGLSKQFIERVYSTEPFDDQLSLKKLTNFGDTLQKIKIFT